MSLTVQTPTNLTAEDRDRTEALNKALIQKADEDEVGFTPKGHALFAEGALGVGTDYLVDGDTETHAADLIASLMHLCDQHSVSFGEVLRRGRRHYSNESLRGTP